MSKDQLTVGTTAGGQHAVFQEEVAIAVFRPGYDGEKTAKLFAAAPLMLHALKLFVNDAEQRVSPESTPGFLLRLAKGREALAAAGSPSNLTPE